MATRRPGLTKTQALRQAKSAAFVKQYEEKQTERKETGRPQVELPKRRKVAPAPEPKKVDFRKPGLTKAMLARQKHAEKFKEEYERKKQAETIQSRRPRRTPAPIGGDARAGRERVSRRETTATQPPARGASTSKRAPTIPQKTRELAKSINADVVQAEPIGEGPIDSVVIPAGTINEGRTTVVSIPQAPPAEAGVSQIANRSMQVISETLDEQDAAEATAVQTKLDELQQARRDFVMTVANVGGNVVSLDDVTPPPEPETPPRYLHRIPPLDHPMFQVEYTIDHPIVEAAREFMRKSLAAVKEREAAKKLDEEFNRIAQQEVDSFRLDVPFEDELYQDKEISWEEDEEMGMIPVPSRVKAYIPPVPERREHYTYDPFDPEELERFFDIKNYPPCPMPRRPLPGREHLHPDLWDIDDPWYRPPPEPDMPDLIQFD